MASGKFSKPRISKKEDQELEQAFRQVTGTKVSTASKYDNSTEPAADGSGIDRNKKIVAIALCTVALCRGVLSRLSPPAWPAPVGRSIGYPNV